MAVLGKVDVLGMFEMGGEAGFAGGGRQRGRVLSIGADPRPDDADRQLQALDRRIWVRFAGAARVEQRLDLWRAGEFVPVAVGPGQESEFAVVPEDEWVPE